MAKKSLNMIEKMMDPNIIDYYIIDCAIPSIITIENGYQIDFGKPVCDLTPVPDSSLAPANLVITLLAWSSLRLQIY